MFEKFIEHIKSYLSQENISLKQFSKQVGYSLPTLVRWLDGKTQPRLRHINKIADIMNCTADYLCGISDDPTKYYNGKSATPNNNKPEN